VHGVLDRASGIDPFTADGKMPSVVLGEVKFERAWFSYPARKDKVVLEDLDLTIAAGSTVALWAHRGRGSPRPSCSWSASTMWIGAA
jgi:ATP-binding cassette subfamily B (MDR/TAP) protein 1